jgi:hypothetical protein
MPQNQQTIGGGQTMFNEYLDWEKVNSLQFVQPTEGTFNVLIKSAKKAKWRVINEKNTKVYLQSNDPEPEDTFVELMIVFKDGPQEGLPSRLNFPIFLTTERGDIARSRFLMLCKLLHIHPAKNQLNELEGNPVKITWQASENCNDKGEPYLNITKIEKPDARFAKPLEFKDADSKQDNDSDIPF